MITSYYIVCLFVCYIKGRHHPSLVPIRPSHGEPRGTCRSCCSTQPKPSFHPNEWPKFDKAGRGGTCVLCQYEKDWNKKDPKKQVSTSTSRGTPTKSAMPSKSERGERGKEERKVDSVWRGRSREFREGMDAARTSRTECTAGAPTLMFATSTWKPRVLDEDVCHVGDMIDESAARVAALDPKALTTSTASFFCIDCGGVAVVARNSRCRECEQCY